jgi:rhamnose utilization protein RhaD (predicted bifunctional aldolase and dehydrogenase)/NAD(P)-dependent dehydrogenase (short-subunit alcohol dehydrogenase family)
VKSRYTDTDAAEFIARYAHTPGCNEDIALRVYTSRLLGSDGALVLHGGGNTSVKTLLRDDTGALVDVLCVKGSGWDLDTLEPRGLPAVRMDSLVRLRERDALSDEDMVNAQRTRLLDASAPNPSVETLLHAFLPATFIDHSHADAVLALANQPNSAELCREVFGDTLAIVPYVMPGFALAKLAAQVAAAHPSAHGLVLLNHGLFTYGATAQESYERHIAAVDKAERFIATRVAALGDNVARKVPKPLDYAWLAPILRGELSGPGAAPRFVLARRTSPAIESLLSRGDLEDLATRGVPTPDHIIRTKNTPLVLRLSADMDEAAVRATLRAALEEYRKRYREYVARESNAKQRTVKALDPDPRVFLIPGVGVVTAGATLTAARIAGDLYEHTAGILENAEALGHYQPLPEHELFDMEYWSLEQAKLGKAAGRPLDARVVFITGAASGIGAACARRFQSLGANVFLTDRDASALATLASTLRVPHAACDVTDATAVQTALEACIHAFGGVDVVVSNAGVAPQGRMHEVALDTLRGSFEVNFFAHQHVAAAATRVMRRQQLGGALLFNASKAAFNPGPDFGPYAIPKAAVVALMKQYALENGDAGIRSNAVNADRVRTGLLPRGFVAERAAARGLSEDAYFVSNLLGAEVRAEDVAQVFTDLALAERTTGCVVTVDGGNIAAAPR